MLKNSKSSQGEAWILFALFLSAVAFKAYLLLQRAPYIDPDEGYYLLLARNIIEGNGYTLNALPNIVFPPFLPLMIAAFYFITHNLQLSLGLITTISGALLGLIIYKLARERFSASFSLLGALVVLFIYQLNAFLPLSKSYTYTLYRGSDTLNVLLIFATLFFVIRMIQRQQLRYAVGAGATAAFAYLTRPEGFVFWALMISILGMLKLTKWLNLLFKQISGFALIFILFSTPYLIYLKNVTGHWHLTGKYGLSQDYHDALVKVIKGGDWEDFKDIHYAINRNRLEMNDYFFGYYKGDQPVKTGVKGALSGVFQNLSLSPVIPKILFPYPFIIVFLIGFTNAAIQIPKSRSALDLVLFSAFLFSISLAAVSYPMPRHHLFLLPVFCFYVLQGIQVSKTFLERRMRRSLVSFILLSIMFLPFASDYLDAYTKNTLHTKEFVSAAAAERSVSDFLRTQCAKVIMTYYPAIAVKSDTDWQVLPKTDIYTLLRFAKKKKVDYIVLFGDDRYPYRVIDLNDSIVPGTVDQPIYYQQVVGRPGFELVRLVDEEEGIR